MPPGARPLLILDLDETLVFADVTPLARAADFVAAGDYHVYRRPRVGEFLRRCAGDFALAVWTSSSADYARAVLDGVTPEGVAYEFVWARDRCTWHRDHEADTQHWVKDLRKVRRRGYALERVLVVDDSPEKLLRSYGNHVRVAPFEGDPADRELGHLYAYLLTLRDVPNVRSVEKRAWRRAVTEPHPAFADVP